MNVDALSLRELRIEIAERLGYSYFWYEGLYQCYMHHRTTPVAATELSGRPDGDKATTVNMDDVPNWPAGIADADALLDDLDRRGAHYELASLAGEGFQLAIITDAPMDEIWSFSARGKTRPEAICRAWLKAAATTE